MRRFALFCCLLLLSACESPLQKLKALNPPATDFASSLASEYLSYAESESEQGRKLGAEWYAAKGLKALQGEAVEPVAPDTSLPPDEQQDLAAARARLMALMTPTIKQAAPQELARAQLLFDCWQHEIRRRINQELAPCQDEFQTTLSELENQADALTYNEETEHTLHFAKGSMRLTAEDHALIREIAREIEGHSNYIISIAALDTIGKRERRLAAGRIANIHRALVKFGVAEKNIRIKKEADSKKVYLSCDVSPGNKGTVMVTVKTIGAP